MATREYSRTFATTGRTTNYLLADIPAGFWRSVRAKAKREGRSMRSLILSLLAEWFLDRPDPNVLQALERGRYYARHYVVHTDADAGQQRLDLITIDDAIARVKGKHHGQK